MKILKLDRKGQGLTEYIALLLLIAVVSFSVTKTLGNRVKEKIKEASNHINSDLTLESGGSGEGGQGQGQGQGQSQGGPGLSVSFGGFKANISHP